MALPPNRHRLCGISNGCWGWHSVRNRAWFNFTTKNVKWPKYPYRRECWLSLTVALWHVWTIPLAYSCSTCRYKRVGASGIEFGATMEIFRNYKDEGQFSKWGPQSISPLLPHVPYSSTLSDSRKLYLPHNSLYISLSLELSLPLRALADHLHQLTLRWALTSVAKTPIPGQVLSLSPYLSLHSGTIVVQNFLWQVLAVFDIGEPWKPSKAS